jgi:orotate phosphoribosyltransferase
MMPESVTWLSGDNMPYFFDLKANSDFSSIRAEIIRLWQQCPSANDLRPAWLTGG